MKLPITDNGVRPAGSPNMCFYCHSPKGAHREDCVCVTKTVVLEMMIPYVVEVPNSWTAEEIEFQRNDSSFCLGNDSEKIFGEMVCLCGYAKIRYVRDASEEDMQELLPFPEEQEAVH